MESGSAHDGMRPGAARIRSATVQGLALLLPRGLGISRSDRDRTSHPKEVIRTSYILDTCAAALCHSQNHSGSVPVPVVGESTVWAPESSFGEFESLLGSRETTRTRHSREGGLHQHHPPASPHTTLDQLPLRRTNRRISSLARHRRLRQELRPEVLHRYHSMAVDDLFRPHPRVVPSLPGHLLVQLRYRTRGLLIPTGLRAARTAPSPGHPALCCGQLRRTTCAVPPVRQIERGVSRGRCGTHTPIDTDTPVGWRHMLDGAAHDERRVPIPERILGHPHTCRLGRQLPRPHHRNTDALRQHQTTVCNLESATCVLQRQPSRLPGLEHWAPSSRDSERPTECVGVGSQHLLLGDLRTRPQPRAPCTCLGQQLA